MQDVHYQATHNQMTPEVLSADTAHHATPDREPGIPEQQAEGVQSDGLGAGDAGAGATQWQPPVYDFSRSPTSISAYRSPVKTGLRNDSFFRTARWCMDGSTILTTGEDRTVRLFSTPLSQDPNETVEAPLEPFLTLAQPSPVLSSIWYPSAVPSVPETFCFAVGLRDAPVRLIDGYSGKIRAVYPIVDHRERFVAPYSMAWNPSGNKLYCGHENAIEILDIASPGYDTSERIKTSRTKNDRGGQMGIISALAFSTDYSGVYAAGSFGGSVSLYTEDGEGAVGHLERVEGGGVTQLAFSPISPTHIFVASRRSTLLQVYDLRNPSQAFHTFARLARTNQRLSFDLDPWGRWLAIGDDVGGVAVWDVGADGKWGETVWDGKVAHDAVTSVQFHPLKPALLVSSGSRTTPTAAFSDSDSSDSSDMSDEDDSDLGDDESSHENNFQDQIRRTSLLRPAHEKAKGRRSGLELLSFDPDLTKP